MTTFTAAEAPVAYTIVSAHGAVENRRGPNGVLYAPTRVVRPGTVRIDGAAWAPVGEPVYVLDTTPDQVPSLFLSRQCAPRTPHEKLFAVADLPQARQETVLHARYARCNNTEAFAAAEPDTLAVPVAPALTRAA